MRPALALHFAKAAASDLSLGRRLVADPDIHLRAAAEWLKCAHDQGDDDGVSWGYSLKGGWRPSYRETSGYIIETLFDLADYLGDDDCRRRAVVIAHWLCRMQNADGSISEPRFGPEGIVFDTGQVLFGLVRAYEETGQTEFLDAAERAGAWLVQVADTDGRWTRNTHLGVPNVYSARVAWALLRLQSHCPQPALERVARANLDWALTQQQEGGLFDHCAFTPGRAPFTHTIAYTLRGLLESGELLGEPRYTEAARAGAEAVARHLRPDGFLPGQISVQGRPRASYCCLTGNCQMALVWLRLDQLNLDKQYGTDEYRSSAADILRYVQSCQDLSAPEPGIRGGIKGSQPIWGRYAPLSYPNWAAKFFVDALLLQSQENPCSAQKSLTVASTLSR